MPGFRFDARQRLLGAGYQARVAQWFQRSLIKSVQQDIVLIGAASTSGTQTISAVVLANSVLNYLSWASDAPAVTVKEDNFLLELTNSTTITASHDTAGQNIAGEFQVVEYWPGVLKSVQRGTITITNGNNANTAAITAVNTAKSSITFLGQKSSGTAVVDYRARLGLSSSTIVTATRVGTTDDITVGYQVVEWY